MTVIQDQFPNPMTPTAQGIHEFKLDAEHNYPMGGMDISDTDGDGEIDMVAVVDGITGNISYAEKSGNPWDTQNYVSLGDFKGASLTIEDVNPGRSVRLLCTSRAHPDKTQTPVPRIKHISSWIISGR